MEAFRDAARQAANRPPQEIDKLLRGADIYTTMMPCPMCAGAIIRFGVTRVVVGEALTYALSGTKELMERQGIEVIVLDEPACVALIETYLAQHPEQRAQRNKGTTLQLKL